MAKRKKRRPSRHGPTQRRPPKGPAALRKAAVDLEKAKRRYRDLIVEAHSAGLTQYEIAAIIGRSQPAVSKLLQRDRANNPTTLR